MLSLGLQYSSISISCVGAVLITFFCCACSFSTLSQADDEVQLMQKQHQKQKPGRHVEWARPTKAGWCRFPVKQGIFLGILTGRSRATSSYHDADWTAIAAAVPGAVDEENRSVLHCPHRPSSNLQDAEPQAPKNVTPGFVGEPLQQTAKIAMWRHSLKVGPARGKGT